MIIKSVCWKGDNFIFKLIFRKLEDFEENDDIFNLAYDLLYQKNNNKLLKLFLKKDDNEILIKQYRKLGKVKFNTKSICFFPI